MVVLENLARRVFITLSRSPFGTSLALGRSLLALGTVLTLSFSPAATFFHSSAPDTSAAVQCMGIARMGLFCLVPEALLDPTRFVLIALCVPALIGFIPALAAPLYFYAAFSLSNNSLGIEGGDQLSTNFAAVLVAICLFDRRIWAWRPRSSGRRQLAHVVPNILMIALLVQMAFLYFEAAMVKASHPLWSEGSALWFWTQQSGFGVREEVQPLLLTVLSVAWISQSVTWGVVVLEGSMAVGIVFARSRNLRFSFIVLGVIFHSVIALLMGLVTFGIAMTACLVIVLWRAGDAIPWPAYRGLSRVRQVGPVYEHSDAR